MQYLLGPIIVVVVVVAAAAAAAAAAVVVVVVEVVVHCTLNKSIIINTHSLIIIMQNLKFAREYMAENKTHTGQRSRHAM